MNVSNMHQALALIGDIERLSTQLDEQLAAWDAATEAGDRTRLLDAVGQMLQTRGTLVEALVRWLSSPHGQRATARERRLWQDALARLRDSDARRADLLSRLVADAGERLRQRTAQRALFIYQRGDT
ncbi:MAG: hypothetical protein N3B17_02070 [Chlorobi bacterium]|jgi:hypothetical protein|nr:hypothetical protein [Chlorobiota bacterium]